MTSGTQPRAKPALGDFWHDLPREGRLLLSIVVVQFLGQGLVLPFWIVYFHEVRDFSLGTAGLLLGLRALIGLLVVGPAGVLIDRFGARVVLLASLGCVIAAELLVAFATTVPLAAAAMVLTGINFGVSFPASQTMIATLVPSSIRQRYFGVNFTLLNLGIGIGGVAGGLLVDVDRAWTFQLLYLLDAVSFVPAVVLLMGPLRHVGGRVEHEADADAAPASYREVLRIPGLPVLLSVTFLASFVAYSQFTTGMPAFGRTVGGVSTQGLGFAFAANTLVIVLIQLSVMRRIEGRRRTRVMAVMAGIWAGSWVLLGLCGLVPGTWGATALLIGCASVFAAGETLLQPTVPAITNDLATDRLRGRVNAIGSGAFQVPMVIGPPVAGWLIGHDLEVVYVALLLVGCAAVAVLAITWLEPRLGPTANGVTPASSEPEVPGEALGIQP